ncbi:MAG: patatin family protein [Spirochaetota bacterium]
MQNHTSALVVEGGAMRSVFSAGILDGFLEKKFNPFGQYFGVSAGAGNIAFFLAGAKGKSIQFFTDLAYSREFIDLKRFLTGGHLLDLDWLFEQVRQRNMLDMHAVVASEKHFFICITEVSSGKALYVRPTFATLLDLIKASTALPVIYRGFPPVAGKPMTDGGVADGIPIEKAIALGATKILVIRARPYSYQKKDTLWHKLIRSKVRNLPKLHHALQSRVEKFEKTIALIRKPPQGVKVIEVCPPESFSIGRFSKNRNKLLQGYQFGKNRADEIIQKWQS